jgi:hypothetical protein
MNKKALTFLVIIVLLAGTVGMVTFTERSRARKALAAYKAKLQAQGEALTFEEAGYPFPLETNANLESFVALADRLRSKSSIPGEIDLLPYESPGRALVFWARGGQIKTASYKAGASPNPRWEELSADMDSSAALLAELRVELEHPPRYFGWNYKDPFNITPKNPFVQKRAVAQFLSADAVAALHEHQLSRAQRDLHALTQLAQVHRSDLMLVSAMIRVAISALALPATWEALPAEGWDDASLLVLQRDWEALDLLEALETGLVGERIFGEEAFQFTRRTNLNTQVKMMSLGARSKPGLAGLREQVTGKATLMYWRGHADEDELFYLQQSQVRVENVRRLRANASGAAIKLEMIAQFTELEQAMDAPLGKYRHLFSALAIPNYSRVFEVAEQRETERRMTITAIALKRFQLRNGSYPAALSELAPQFLAAELVDPWSGRPLHYQLNADGTFTLYSVGADGRDDGGDPASVQATNAPSLWTGKDAVWPVPVLPAPQ